MEDRREGATRSVQRVFVTGASGLLGNSLVPVLLGEEFALTGLTRSRPAGGESDIDTWEAGTIRRVRGDLCDPASYAPTLRGSDTVVHLAAVTGKASRRRFLEVNVEGTRALLDECLKTGVARFLYVSSIAVKFPQELPYHYARSKAAAEELVAGSGIPFCIVRPTIILGAHSTILQRLASLATLPVMPLVAGGRARVQPIDVGDLARFIGLILSRDLFGGETLELGGPEVLSIGELLQEIRRLKRGGSARTFSLPARPTIAILSAVERIAGPLLPINVGQLASFIYDGVIENNPLYDEHRIGLKGVREMLASDGAL